MEKADLYLSATTAEDQAVHGEADRSLSKKETPTGVLLSENVSEVSVHRHGRRARPFHQCLLQKLTIRK